VKCKECGQVLHENTTGPQHYIWRHERQVHPDRVPVELMPWYYRYLPPKESTT
jgi:hypothetical protein